MTDITVVGAGGEYMESVVVVAWHKKKGESVKAGELVVTVETAKAATEIEAPVSGILSDIRAQIGEEVAIGTVLGTLSEDGADTAAPAVSAAQTAPPAAPPAAVPAEAYVAAAGGERINASPLARRVAASRGIDLAGLVASSPSGRIKLRDVDAVVAVPAERPVAGTTASASVSAGVSLTRRGSGEGTPFVFLHGFGADSFSWQPLLATLGVEVPAVLVDLPGHGRSPAMDGAGSLEGLAFAVARALAGAGIEQCHLVGHSLGGAVAIALAEAGRLAPLSLTLIAPAGLGPDIDGDFISGFCRATRAESLKPWLLRLFADPTIVTPGYVQAALNGRGDALRQAQAALAGRIFPDGTQAVEMRCALRRVAVPQKIIWGEGDRIIPMRHALGTGPQAGIHLLPNVGHMPHVEAAATVARLVLQNARSAG